MIQLSWDQIFKSSPIKEILHDIKPKVQKEYQHHICYPKYEEILRAFDLTTFESVKVVILGQDPYHGENQAHGLAFSVPATQKAPPSLVNIFKELEDDINCSKPSSPDLTKWAEQGVLLLNTTLTVRSKLANSHVALGWEKFTDEVIKVLSDSTNGIVFILWGAHAQKKAILINEDNHLILKSPHPSPLSSYRGFFGSKPFSKTNEFLKSIEKTPIDWSL